MNDGLWSVLVPAAVSLVVPFIAYLINRDPRDDIQKDLSVLKQLQSGTETYQHYEKWISFKIWKLSANEKKKRSYRDAYLFYALSIFFAVGVFLDGPLWKFRNGSLIGTIFWYGIAIFMILFFCIAFIFFLLAERYSLQINREEPRIRFPATEQYRARRKHDRATRKQKRKSAKVGPPAEPGK